MLNRKGYSIVSVLIAAAMALAVTSAAVQLTLNNKSSFESFKGSVGKMNLMQDLQSTFYDSTVCKTKIQFNNLANINSGTLALNFLVNGTSIGSNNQAAKLLYDLDNVTITYKNIQSDGLDPNTNYKKYKGDIFLTTERKLNYVGGKRLKDILVGSLSVTIDNSQNLYSCIGINQSSLSPKAICDSVGGYYNGTSCVASPQCPAGQLMVSNGPGVPGTCKNPPVQIVQVVAPAPAPAPAPTPAPTPVVAAATPPAIPSGTLTGSASCSQYLQTDPRCAGAGCGGTALCPSTWSFSGSARSGGCSAGNVMSAPVYSQTNGRDLVGYTCVSQ